MAGRSPGAGRGHAHGPPRRRDTCLAGTPDQIREQLHGLRAAGVNVVFVPSSFRPLAELRPDLDRLIGEIAPAFR
ncbi:MAG: hypothetical protein DMD91_30095 [Candidatus Rokuibacteriota bacterium]|nr:MAG: hypothetical protein DMD91_30095 [Candidatus Rokubacteria bacterium]